MRAGGSSAKGASFERAVCRELSLWISGGARDDVFWRAAMSGGRATIGLRRGIKRGGQAGDVSLIDALGERLLKHVVVDCKFWSDLHLLQGVAKDTGRLYKFWHDLRRHAAEFGKHPMLVARQNNMPTMCLLSSATSFVLFRLGPDHVSALLPRWDCCLVLYDVFLREATVPDAALRAPVTRRRPVLAAE